MKVKKIYEEIIKEHLNQKSRAAYGRWKEYVVFIPDGFRLYLLPEKDFPVDLEKVPKGELLSASTIEGLLKGEKDSSVAELTDEMRELKKVGSSKKGVAVKIESENSHAWFNKDLLKNFEPTGYKIKDFKSPAYIYEGYDEKLVGMVLPVRMDD